MIVLGLLSTITDGCRRQQAVPPSQLPPLMLNLLVVADAEPGTGPVPMTVQFTSEVYEGDEAVDPKFEWDFGDGSRPSKEQNPVHTYKTPGFYKVLLRVKDATGRTGSADLDIEAQEPEEAAPPAP
jgi:hypothetical protein